MPLFERFLCGEIKERLGTNCAVGLLGARQVGKSTLAKKFIAPHYESLYLDLESPKDLAKLGDPYSFLSRHKDKLVIIDEIQRSPELFPVLRVLIDEGRESGRKGAQYLILGSASKGLIRQSSESLAGRISYVKINPFNLFEVPSSSTEKVIDLWVKGGYPKSYLAFGKETIQWREDFLTSYLERDITQFGFNVPAVTWRRLFTMLAHNNGQLFNASQIAKSMGLNSKTVQRYVDTLGDLFLTTKLHPMHTNIKKRLVKSPRIYIGDSGLLHSLLHIESYDDLLSHPIAGTSWEGFVINNILSILPDAAIPLFYRTSAGAEIDLVLTIKQEVWAIEIKKSAENLGISKGFHQACRDIGAHRKIVVYGGDGQFPYKGGVTVFGVSEVLKEIQGQLSHS